jgi:hypothetical protein
MEKRVGREGWHEREREREIEGGERNIHMRESDMGG